jgi:hypothetical protein
MNYGRPGLKTVFFCAQGADLAADFGPQKSTRPAVSLVVQEEAVNRKLGIGQRPDAPMAGRGLDSAPFLMSAGLILTEELLGIFNKTDDDDHGGTGHAYEKHDLECVHCE